MWSLALSWVGIAAILIVGAGFVSSVIRPRPRAVGDTDLAPELEQLCSRRTRRLAACVIERAEHPSARSAFVRAEATTRFEIGSVTKALTGLLLADALERGEVTLDMQVGEVITEVRGTTLGTVTLRELCTHTSGLPRMARTPALIPRLMLYGWIGLDPGRGVSAKQLFSTAARQHLRNRGDYRYSNLGAAVLGQVLVRAAGGDFPDLLTTRICTPLGIEGAGVSAPGQSASWGWSSLGLPRMPCVLDGYAPAGGVFATLPDLAALAVALLDGTAPGLPALSPLCAQDEFRQIGMFWVIDTVPETQRRMVWHNGATGGYSAFLALFPHAHRAVVVVADTSRPRDTERVAVGLARWLALSAMAR